MTFGGQKTHSGDFDFPPLKNVIGILGLVRCFFTLENGGVENTKFDQKRGGGVKNDTFLTFFDFFREIRSSSHFFNGRIEGFWCFTYDICTFSYFCLYKLIDLRIL